MTHNIYDVIEEKYFKFQLQPGNYKIYWNKVTPTRNNAYHQLINLTGSVSNDIICQINSDDENQSFNFTSIKDKEYHLSAEQRRHLNHPSEAGQCGNINTSGFTSDENDEVNYFDFKFQLPNCQDCIIRIEVEKNNHTK